MSAIFGKAGQPNWKRNNAFEMINCFNCTMLISWNTLKDFHFHYKRATDLKEWLQCQLIKYILECTIFLSTSWLSMWHNSASAIENTFHRAFGMEKKCPLAHRWPVEQVKRLLHFLSGHLGYVDTRITEPESQPVNETRTETDHFTG